MDLANHAAKRVDLAQLSDKELIKRYCADRSNRICADTLWERCEDIVKRTIKRVEWRYRPREVSSQDFVDASLSHAWENFVARVGGYDVEGGKLPGLWTSVSNTTVIDVS